MAIAGLAFGVAVVAGLTPAVGSAAVMSPGPGTQLWVSRYNSPVSGGDGARSVAVSPDGTTVFVTGYTAFTRTDYEYGTIAYDAATGAQLWASRYGSGNGSFAYAVAVSPDGQEVFVTGRSSGQANYDYATVAYNAATGAQLWVSRYNGPANNYDAAAALAVSPDGTRVFVTGTSWSATSVEDYLTIAYDAATGRQRWIDRYNGPGNRDDFADSIAVAPNGAAVYVTGTSQGTNASVSSSYNYATVAYSTTTGTQLWLSRFRGPLNLDFAAALTVSPTTGAVFVTGYSKTNTTNADYPTINYNGTTGAQQWAKRYNGPSNGNDQATALANSPDGNTVYVTGASQKAGSGYDYATVAYNTATGARLWVNRYNGPANSDDTPYAVAASPDGNTVYVTGASQGATSGGDYATVAYNAAAGTRLWAKRYNGPGNGNDTAYSLAVSPTAGTVFITGGSLGASNSLADFATVAYHS